jgi:hypothetical protein
MNIWGLKPDVVREAVKLAKAIKEAGGVPFIAILPWQEFCAEMKKKGAVTEPKKAGVDDVLAVLGEKAVMDALNYAVFAEPSKYCDSHAKGMYLDNDGEFQFDSSGKSKCDVKWIGGWLTAWHGHIQTKDSQKAFKAALKDFVKAGLLTGDESLGIYERAKASSGTTVRGFIQSWLAAKNLKYSYRTMSPVGKKPASTCESMILDKTEQELGHKDHEIRYAFNEWVSKEDEKFIAAMNQELNANSGLNAGHESLKTFVRCISSSEGRRLELDIAEMRHFIWQVKRKLANKSVDYHTMCVLYGQSNSGKTTALERLFDPIRELLDRMDLHQLGDDREYFRLARSYVIFIDEISNSVKKVDVENLKKSISAMDMNWRKLTTNFGDYGRNVATFIASANWEVRDIIKDPTSARRYWQIHCLDKDELRKNQETINSLDYIAIWRSVSVDEKCPILDYLAEIEVIQDRELRCRSPLEEFLETETEPGGYTLVRDVEKAYRDYLEKYGIREASANFKSINKFSIEMGKLGHESVPRNVGKSYKLTLSSAKFDGREETKAVKLMKLYDAKEYPRN